MCNNGQLKHYIFTESLEYLVRKRLPIWFLPIISDSVIDPTDYGLPMKPFSIEILNFWAWADKIWGIWGIFG